MKYPAILPSLLAAFCLAAPATGLSHDHHHHDYHGHSHYYGSIYRPYPYFYGSYPYYYSSPSFGLTFYNRPYYSYESTYYRGVPRYDDNGDDLSVDVQRALSRRGYYHGAIDGDVGAGTRAAIRRYQYEHRLEVTGRIDRSLLHSLGLN